MIGNSCQNDLRIDEALVKQINDPHLVYEAYQARQMSVGKRALISVEHRNLKALCK